jgi:hypothetical protein
MVAILCALPSEEYGSDKDLELSLKTFESSERSRCPHTKTKFVYVWRLLWYLLSSWIEFLCM